MTSLRKCGEKRCTPRIHGSRVLAMKKRLCRLVIAVVVVCAAGLFCARRNRDPQDIAGTFFAVEHHPGEQVKLETGKRYDYHIAHFLRLREDNTYSCCIFVDAEEIVKSNGHWEAYREHGQLRMRFSDWRTVDVVAGRIVISRCGMSDKYVTRNLCGRLSIPLDPDRGYALKKQK